MRNDINYLQTVKRSVGLAARRYTRVGVVLAFVAASQAAEDETKQTTARALFALKANCFECHNPGKAKADLDLTSREAILKGGESGPAVVVGRPAESALVSVLAPDADPHMPPKAQLPDARIADLRRWIEAGAAWDAEALKAESTLLARDALGGLPAGYQPALALALSSDGKRLAVGRGNRVFIHDASTNSFPVIATLEGHMDTVQSLAWSRDGNRLASGGFRRALLWDAGKWKAPLATIEEDLEGRVTALDFSSDDAMLILADSRIAESGMVRLFSVGEKPRARWSWQAHADEVFDLEVSPDGTKLATAGADRLAKVWDLKSRKLLASFEGHADFVTAVAFRKDKEQLASAGADKEIKVWDLKTGQLLKNNRYDKEFTFTFPAHGKGVTGLRWLDGGETIVSVCEDGGARWCTELKKQKQRSLAAAGEILYCVAATGDGGTILAGSESGVVYAWGEDGKIKARLEPPAAKKAETAAK